MNIEKELETVYRMANALRVINLLKASLTVGIMAFTVLSIVGIFFAKDWKAQKTASFLAVFIFLTKNGKILLTKNAINGILLLQYKKGVFLCHILQ